MPRGTNPPPSCTPGPPGRTVASKEQLVATITFMGKDRTGVVAKVTQALFDEGANIESLEEQVSRGFFSMSLQASWPAAKVDSDEERRIKQTFSRIGKEVKMEARVRFHHVGKKQRMAILVTHESHCFEGLIAAAKKGSLKAEPVVVISNRKTLQAKAKAAGLPFRYISFDDRVAAEDRLIRVLDKEEVDFLVLARFMKILSPGFCWRFRNKIINIHPSLLPAFPGANAYRQAWEKGVRVIGVTAHFVTPDLDQGPIIAQDAVSVRPDDEVKDLVRKGQALEAKVLVEAVQLYLKKRLDVHWGRVWAT